MNKTKTALAVMLLAGGVSSFATANEANQQDPDFYVGARLGVSQVTDMDVTVTNNTGIDKNSTAMSVYGGVKIVPWLAFEAGYTDLGKVNLKDVDGDYKTSGIDMSARFIYNIDEQFDVYGRLGVLLYDWKASGESVCCSDTGISSNIAVGGEYKFAEAWGAQAEYRYFGNIGGSPDFHTYNLGLNYYF